MNHENMYARAGIPLPFVKYDWFNIEGRFIGLSLVEQLRPSQKAYNRSRSHAIEFQNTGGYAPVFLPKGSSIKAMRLMLIYKQGIRELKQLVHPNAVIPLKVGRRRVEAAVVSAVWSFFAVYMSAFIIILLLLMATGLDFTTAFSAVAASLNNLGPGLGEVAANYSSINEVAKGLLLFRVDEGEDSRDWNDDNDMNDTVLLRTTISSGFTAFVALIDPQPRPCVYAGTEAAAYVANEAASGTDYNGDGDTADFVIRHFRF